LREAKVMRMEYRDSPDQNQDFARLAGHGEWAVMTTELMTMTLRVWMRMTLRTEMRMEREDWDRNAALAAHWMRRPRGSDRVRVRSADSVRERTMSLQTPKKAAS
jgi:hypothetical protein